MRPDGSRLSKLLRKLPTDCVSFEGVREYAIIAATMQLHRDGDYVMVSLAAKPARLVDFERHMCRFTREGLFIRVDERTVDAAGNVILDGKIKYPKTFTMESLYHYYAARSLQKTRLLVKEKTESDPAWRAAILTGSLQIMLFNTGFLRAMVPETSYDYLSDWLVDVMLYFDRAQFYAIWEPTAEQKKEIRGIRKTLRDTYANRSVVSRDVLAQNLAKMSSLGINVHLQNGMVVFSGDGYIAIRETRDALVKGLAGAPGLSAQLNDFDSIVAKLGYNVVETIQSSFNVRDLPLRGMRVTVDGFTHELKDGYGYSTSRVKAGWIEKQNADRQRGAAGAFPMDEGFYKLGDPLVAYIKGNGTAVPASLSYNDTLNEYALGSALYNARVSQLDPTAAVNFLNAFGALAQSHGSGGKITTTLAIYAVTATVDVVTANERNVQTVMYVVTLLAALNAVRTPARQAAAAAVRNQQHLVVPTVGIVLAMMMSDVALRATGGQPTILGRVSEMMLGSPPSLAMGDSVAVGGLTISQWSDYAQVAPVRAVTDSFMAAYDAVAAVPSVMGNAAASMATTLSYPAVAAYGAASNAAASTVTTLSDPVVAVYDAASSAAASTATTLRDPAMYDAVYDAANSAAASAVMTLGDSVVAAYDAASTVAASTATTLGAVARFAAATFPGLPADITGVQPTNGPATPLCVIDIELVADDDFCRLVLGVRGTESISTSDPRCIVTRPYGDGRRDIIVQLERIAYMADFRYASNAAIGPIDLPPIEDFYSGMQALSQLMAETDLFTFSAETREVVRVVTTHAVRSLITL